jgi:asparagine N-glycosylation enzyme membrane subunit Stt3
VANQRTAPARRNGTYAFVAALAGVLLGLFAPGWYGAVLLYAIVAALAVLLSANWRSQKPATIAFRILIMAIFVILATRKIS